MSALPKTLVVGLVMCCLVHPARIEGQAAFPARLEDYLTKTAKLTADERATLQRASVSCRAGDAGADRDRVTVPGCEHHDAAHGRDDG